MDHDMEDRTDLDDARFDEIFDYDFDQIILIDNNKGIFEYKRNGVQDYVLNKLKRKNVSDIPIEIDLHGETVKDAILKLDDF